MRRTRFTSLSPASRGSADGLDGIPRGGGEWRSALFACDLRKSEIEFLPRYLLDRHPEPQLRVHEQPQPVAVIPPPGKVLCEELLDRLASQDAGLHELAFRQQPTEEKAI